MKVWESDRWVKRQLKFLELARDGIFERESPLLESVISNSDSTTVVDFGGGSGWLYHKIKSLGIQFENYIIVESRDLHNECNHTKNDYSFVKSENLDMVRLETSSLVILYLNSVMQYLESDSILVEVVNILNPTKIILEDVTLSQSVEFFAFQKYYETRIPYRFVDLNILVSILNQSGYVLTQKLLYQRNIAPGYTYEFREQSLDFHIGETVSLEFTKL